MIPGVVPRDSMKNNDVCSKLQVTNGLAEVGARQNKLNCKVTVAIGKSKLRSSKGASSSASAATTFRRRFRCSGRRVSDTFFDALFN